MPIDKLITSTANPEIRFIRKLNDKQARDESGLFFVEGIRPVIEAYAQQASFHRLIVCPELLRSQIAKDFVSQFSMDDILVLEASETVFKTLANKEGPQGLAAVIRQRWDSIAEIGNNKNGIWMGLDSIQDPGNLGSILRTLDGVGGSGILLLDQTTDVYHPTAVRASMGALFTQKIIQADRIEFIEWKKKTGFPCFGAVCDAVDDYQSIQYPHGLILLMGSEQKGLNRDLAEVCDRLVHIPMNGHVDSLNLANAASVMLYEVYNQRRRKG
jgi:RNA methyltransferase, TrmH family